MYRLFVALLLLLSSADSALPNDLYNLAQGSAGGSDFIFVVTARQAVGIPTTVVIPANTQQQPSFILQRGRSAGRVDSYVLTATFSYKLDTDPTKFKAAAQNAQVSLTGLSAISLLRYTTSSAVWNASSSKFDIKQIDQGTVNPTGSMVVAFSIEFADAEAVRIFFQNPRSLYVLLDLQADLQVPAVRDTKAIDELTSKAFESAPVSGVMPTLKTFQILERQFPSTVGSNPGYVADSISRAVNGLTLSLDTQGRPTYVQPGTPAPNPVIPPSPPSVSIRALDRIGLASNIDLCTDPTRLNLMDIGKTGCNHLGDLLGRH